MKYFAFGFAACLAVSWILRYCPAKLWPTAQLVDGFYWHWWRMVLDALYRALRWVLLGGV